MSAAGLVLVSVGAVGAVRHLLAGLRPAGAIELLVLRGSGAAVAHHLAKVRVAGSNPVFRSQSGPGSGLWEFLSFDPLATPVALREAIDGTVLLPSCQPDFDVRAYGEEWVTSFHLATRGPE